MAPSETGHPQRRMSLPTVLGLAIGIAGLIVGLITLRPQLSASAGDPVEKLLPFSVPFQITNTGYLPVRSLRVFCDAVRVRLGGSQVTRAVIGRSDWDTDILQPNESRTIECRLVRTSRPPEIADLVIVAKYRATGIPITLTRMFRFVGRFGDTWQWTKQPIEEVGTQVKEDIQSFETDIHRLR